MAKNEQKKVGTNPEPGPKPIIKTPEPKKPYLPDSPSKPGKPLNG